jgi:hypothetical protein
VTESQSPATTFSTEDARWSLQRGDFGSTMWAFGPLDAAPTPLFVPGIPPNARNLTRAITTASGDASAAAELAQKVLSEHPEYLPGGRG